MSSEHSCKSSVCALCGVPSCLDAKSFPLRMQDSLGWTHQLIEPHMTSPFFTLHASCFAIFRQQYECMDARVPSDDVLIESIRERVGPTPLGQLGVCPTWSDGYKDYKTGRGPQQAYFPDGWRTDPWELALDPELESRGTDMDFLLRDPLADQQLESVRLNSSMEDIRIPASSLSPEEIGNRLSRAFREQERLSALPVELREKVTPFLSEQTSNGAYVPQSVHVSELSAQEAPTRTETAETDPFKAYRAVLRHLDETDAGVNHRRIRHSAKQLVESILGVGQVIHNRKEDITIKAML